MTNNNEIIINMQQQLGSGYGKFFKFRGRYRVIKGSRNSKKSYNMIGIAPVWDIISNPLNNVMMLRAVDKDNRQSTFANIKSAIRRMGLRPYFNIKESTMEIIYKQTGQKIFFRGCNDPESITSVAVDVGVLNKLYIEEAYQIRDYQTFRMIDGSFRGEKINDDTYFQITMVFNGWSQDTWLYDEFFKGRLEDDVETLEREPKIEYINENEAIGFGVGLYLMTNNYKINEHRDKETWDVAMETLKIKAPAFYYVEGLGCWGNASESTYPEWKESLVHKQKEINELQYDSYSVGIDTGLADGEGKVKRGEDVKVRSATTMCLCGLTSDYENLVAIDEYYHSNELQEIMTEPQLIEAMLDKILEWEDRYYYHRVLMKGTICVYVDSASRGFRESMQYRAEQRGMMNVRFIASTKQKIQTRVDFTRLLMALDKLKISELCVNLCREFKNSKHGQKGEVREDIDDHCINSNEYGSVVLLPRLKQWHSFKER